MRRYETIFISDPDISPEARTQLFDRVQELIPQQEGTLIAFDDWGNRRLAYEIKKKPRGHYVRLDMCGLGGLVAEMERFFKIDDRVMKFMTILTDENVTAAKLEELTRVETPEEEAAAEETVEAAEATKDETKPEAAEETPVEAKDA